MSKIQNEDMTATLKAPRAYVLSTRLPSFTSSESSSPRSLTDPLVLYGRPGALLSDDPQVLAAEIITHLSHLHPGDALFTATAWPAFIAGLETRDLASRAWVEERFQELWKTEPWGFTREALVTLRTIWGGSNNEIVLTRRHNEPYKREDNGNWIERLKSLGTD